MLGLSTKEKIIKKQTEYIAKLEDENRRLKLKSSDTLDDKLERNCSEFVIDFEKMNAFSIERIPTGQDERPYKTSIGYFFNDHVKEWTLWCNRDTHNLLAQQFREYMQVQQMTSKGKKK